MASPQILSADVLFAEALVLPPGAERTAYLREACGQDADLRRRVERLLKAHDEAGDFLAGGDPHETTDVTQDVSDDSRSHAGRVAAPGMTIGPYKLLEEIGEGGFGMVFLAEQQQPVRRKVALKLIKPGMDSRQVIARFEAERQALAIMDHPNIAKVFDGGATPSGVPYFVMELVKGVPITDYCDQHQLTPRARLELFVPVCQAVQHAHQKGIIHRDLKPSNVLVAVHDATPAPKVIDFGVAKALGRELTDGSVFTGLAQMIGTPLYMSPEQAGQSGLDIDTRSDIYSLGVLLYELLTGATPFDKDRFQRAAYDEIRRIIREEEPPKPSTRLSDSQDSLPSVSALRHMEPAKLTRQVRGELDWIVMKALEKDRNRRYETANGFAADVQRYLNDQPVLACPPSAAYRLRKFVKRNWTSVLVTTIVLTLAIVGTSVGAALVLREKDRTEDALTESRQSEAAARAAADEVKAVLHYVVWEILGSADPARRRGRDLTVLDALNNAEQQIDKAFADQPLVEAYVRHVIGSAFKELGDYRNAERHLRRAVEIRTQELGAEHVNTLSTSMNLASSLQHQGRLTEARRMNEQALALKRRLFGPEHPDTLDAATNLANVYIRLGCYQEARELHEHVFEVRLRSQGEESPETLTAMCNLGNALFDLGEARRAMDYYEQAENLRTKVLGDDHPETLVAMMNRANGLSFFGKDREALALYKKTLELQKRVLGPDHQQTIETLANMVRLLDDRESLEEGRQMLEGAHAACSRQFGEDHPDTLLVQYNLGQVLGKLGDLPQATARLEATIAAQARTLGEEHPHTLDMRAGLAGLLMAHGKYDDARKIYEPLLEAKTRIHGPDDAATLSATHDLAVALYRGGQWFEAHRLLEKTLRRKRSALGAEHPDTLNGMSSLAAVLITLNRIEQAGALIDEAMPLMRKVLGEEHSGTIIATNNLIEVRARQGQTKEAVRLAEDTLKLRQRLFGPEHKQTIDALDTLANLRADSGDLKQGREMKEEVLALRTRIFGREHPDTLRTMHNLMCTLMEMDELAEARRVGEETLELRRRVLPPDHPNTLDTMHDLACILTYQDDWEAALPLFEYLQPKEAATRGPDHEHTLNSTCNLANTLHQLAAIVRAEQGMFQERDEMFQRALKLVESLLEKQPDNRGYQVKLAYIRTDLARFLAGYSDPALRRPAEAVRHAKQAVDVLPKAWVCLNTLALAQYRSGEWQAARKTLLKAMDCHEWPVPQDGLLMVMTLWKLDRQEDARRQFEACVGWMERNKPPPDADPLSLEELERLKSEAAALLGTE